MKDLTPSQKKQHARLLQERYDDPAHRNYYTAHAQADKILAEAELAETQNNTVLQETDCTITRNYKNYGGRGINVCKKWENFIIFKNDMLINYLKHTKFFGESDTQIDRKNNNGNYCKNNCRWATRKEQHQNTRRKKPALAKIWSSLARKGGGAGVKTEKR